MSSGPQIFLEASWGHRLGLLVERLLCAWRALGLEDLESSQEAGVLGNGPAPPPLHIAGTSRAGSTVRSRSFAVRNGVTLGKSLYLSEAIKRRAARPRGREVNT